MEGAGWLVHAITNIRALVFPLVLLGCGARTELDVLHGGGDGGVDAPDAPAACRVSAPTILFSAGGNAGSLVVDAASVYWSAGDRVHAVDKSGANHRIIASGRNLPTGLALAGGFVYWGESYSGLIVRAPASGQGGVDVLAPSLAGYTVDVTVLGSDVYWCSLGGTVARLLGTSSTPELVAVGDGSDTSITTDGRFVFYAARPGPVPSGNIYRYDPAAKTIKRLADSLAGVPWSLATDDGAVYFNEVFVESGTQTIIASVGKSGGPTKELAQVAVAAPICPAAECRGAVATDGRFVYFTSDESDGFVRKVPVSGGASVVVADHQPQPEGVAVDEGCVYWSNYADGDIMIAPK